jgi:hypothetical protein
LESRATGIAAKKYTEVILVQGESIIPSRLRLKPGENERNVEPVVGTARFLMVGSITIGSPGKFGASAGVAERNSALLKLS